MTERRPPISYVRTVGKMVIRCRNCSFTACGAGAAVAARQHVRANPDHMVAGTQVTTVDWWAER